MADRPEPRLSNIDDDGQRFRMFFAVLLFFFAPCLTAIVTVAEAPLPLKLAVFVPAWLCTLFFFQAHEKICVFLAAKGASSGELGTEMIDDPDLAEQLRQRAGRIQLKAFGAGMLYTILLLSLAAIVPWRIPLPEGMQ